MPWNETDGSSQELSNVHFMYPLNSKIQYLWKYLGIHLISRSNTVLHVDFAMLKAGN